jgi:hypothetical protein
MRQKSGPEKQPAEEAIKDIRVETTLSLWSARISASRPYVVGCYGSVALANRCERASLITSDSALLELVGYVEATRSAWLIALSQVRPYLVAARLSHRDFGPRFAHRPRHLDACRPLSFCSVARA